MAELIDKDAFIKWFKENYELEVADDDTGEVTEYDRWISSVDYIDAIERFPTVTEVDIRNKAISEFAKAVVNEMECFAREQDGEENVGFIEMCIDIANEIAEQLKEG